MQMINGDAVWTVEVFRDYATVYDVRNALRTYAQREPNSLVFYVQPHESKQTGVRNPNKALAFYRASAH